MRNRELDDWVSPISASAPGSYDPTSRAINGAFGLEDPMAAPHDTQTALLRACEQQLDRACLEAHKTLNLLRLVVRFPDSVEAKTACELQTHGEKKARARKTFQSPRK